MRCVTVAACLYQWQCVRALARCRCEASGDWLRKSSAEQLVWRLGRMTMFRGVGLPYIIVYSPLGGRELPSEHRSCHCAQSHRCRHVEQSGQQGTGRTRQCPKRPPFTHLQGPNGLCMHHARLLLALMQLAGPAADPESMPQCAEVADVKPSYLIYRRWRLSNTIASRTHAHES